MFSDIFLKTQIFFMNAADAVHDAPHIVKNAIQDTQILANHVNMAIEDGVTELKESTISLNVALNDMIVDAAYNMNFHLGEFVEQSQKAGDVVVNVVNAPKNLTLCGEKITLMGCSLADHLFIRRGVYTHHGIYIGDGMVMHYADAKDMSVSDIRIHSVTFEEFADGQDVYYLDRKESPLIYTPEEAVQRAKSRVVERDYNLFGNNCEQFVRWCRCGRK